LDLDELKGWTLRRLPLSVRKLHDETLSALRHGAPILVTAGLRATVEAICADKDVKGGNLKQRIQGLVEKGVLASDQVQFLHLHRLLGNDARHDFTPPSQAELTAALQILQNLPRTVYELPGLAASVEAGRALRKE
jgi:hypothetical protein